VWCEEGEEVGNKKEIDGETRHESKTKRLRSEEKFDRKIVVGSALIRGGGRNETQVRRDKRCSDDIVNSSN
jgi:hypothetical protein